MNAKYNINVLYNLYRELTGENRGLDHKKFHRPLHGLTRKIMLKHKNVSKILYLTMAAKMAVTTTTTTTTKMRMLEFSISILVR